MIAGQIVNLVVLIVAGYQLGGFWLSVLAAAYCLFLSFIFDLEND